MKTKKLIFKLTSILTIMLLFFTACKNESEEVVILDNPGAVNGMKVINYGYYGKDGKSSSGTSIAVFSDQRTFDNTLSSLESQVEAWDDQFLAQWGHLDEEALDAKEIELNYDDEKPLTDFENSVGLSSLRKRYLAEEEAWLNNEELNPLTDPDNKVEYDFDDSEKTVLNRYSEVQIGTKIIKELNDDQIQDINQAMERSSKFGKSNLIVDGGATLVIAEEDYNSLIDFNEGDMSIIENDNVTVQNTNTAASCEYGKSKRATIQTSSSRRIKALVKVPQPRWGWNGKVKTKIKSYKKRGSRWKKRRTHIAAGARGTVGNVSCTGETFFINNQWTSTKKRRKRVFKWKNPYWTSHVVENGGMTGLFKQDGVIKELKLTW